MKKHYYHIITFGCQMNKSDSERLESVLVSMGMKATDRAEKADVILMNSCSVRQTAEDRVYGLCYNFSKLKKDKPNLILCVTGCMAGRDKEGKMRKRMRDADLVFPTHEMTQLPQRLEQINPDLRATENIKDNDYLAVKPIYKSDFQAFVTVQTGCNHFCTYCVVPHARGTEGNRSLKQILDEVKYLAKKGCLEVTLLGQIINHYIAPDPEYFSDNNPYKESDFAKLLWEINQIDGIKRLHWTGPHPTYMTDEVIDAMTLPKQINFLHLPLQSGSTQILEKMNRRHNRELYIDLVKKIKNKLPEIALGTDIIVGFCGESEQDFQDTIDLYKQCEFDISYTAKYSVRDGTTAEKMFDDDVPKDEKKRRWFELQELMEDITMKKNKKYEGKEVSVLVDKCVHGECSGQSSEMKLVSFKGTEDMIGTIQNIRITNAKTWILYGEVVV